MPGEPPADNLDGANTIQISHFAGGQKIFRRYVLKKILGRGGMGVVWLAHDEQLESLVALKVLPDTLLADGAALDSLKCETKMGRSLAHPNIVRIFDFQQDENLAAISMEYVDGGNLSDLRIHKPNKIFEPEELSEYLDALCDGLDYAHTRERIVHRDLKPRNLMVNSRGQLKIADFGISKSIAESMTMVTGMLGSSGSPPYTSPQQWDGERPTPLDDIYSVGATLYELLTGKPPLLGVIDGHRIHTAIPPPMSQRRLDLGIQTARPLPPHWEDAIAACLAKDPKQRPQSMAELHGRLTGDRSRIFRVPSGEPPGRLPDAGPGNAVPAEGSGEEFDATIVRRARPIRVSDIASAQAAGEVSDDTYDVTIVRNTPTFRERRAPAVPATDPRPPGTSLRAPQEELPAREVSDDSFDVTIVRKAPPVRESVTPLPAAATASTPPPVAKAGFQKPAEPPPKTQHLEPPPAETRASSHTPSLIETPAPPAAAMRRQKRAPVWVWAACAAVVLLAGSVALLKNHPAAPPPVTLTSGDLTIESAPAGAAITLDGGGPVKTPYAFKKVGFGTHRISLSLDGYLPVTEDLQFNGANPSIIVLQPRPALPTALERLSVRSEPPGASIRLDGAPPDKPPGTFTNVKFGSHQLTATLDGYEAKQQALPVTPGMAAELILTLNRNQSTPAPDPIEAAEKEIDKYNAAQDTPGYLDASLELVRLLTTGGEPASPMHSQLLERTITGLRTKSHLLGGDEFSEYKDNFLLAAHRDIVPAILLLADNLKAANSTEAFGWYYYAAATKQNPYAMRMLAWLYWLGECGVTPDKQTGFQWFKHAYETGDTIAGAILGNCYLRGDGTSKDEEAGITVLLPLANAGVADAQTLIGECYYYGYGEFATLTEDERNQKAVDYFQKAIAGKDWAACGHLGVLYETGEGVTKDWKEAVKLYLQGVDNQNPVCMYYYARAIENHPDEIKKVFGRNDKAESYYKMAATAGIADARAWCVDHKVQF